MDCTAWIPAGVLASALWFSRKSIAAGIEQSVRHHFENKLEALRSELRTREGELNALRDHVLGGQAGRQALVTKRQIEAVEHVWNGVAAHAPHKYLASYL